MDEELRRRARELAAELLHEPAATTTRNTLAGGTAHGPVVQAGSISGLTFHTTASPGGLPEPAGWPTAADLDPIAFGVRPAQRLAGHPDLPPYVVRDRDAALDAALARARAEGGLVLVLGEPFTGKTRTALAALVRGPAGRRVCAPARGTDLRGLPALLHGRPERHVIWLDDLDEHLGDGGLEPRLLAQLAALHVVVLATMREDAYDDCRVAPRGRVLDLAHTVELAREWSPGERDRLAQEAARTGDPRLLDATLSAGPEGAAAHLALSPLLHEEWWRARRADRHPRGHALVRAALDLARCGLTGHFPMDLLLTAHEHYADVTGLERESAEDARAWATERRHGLLGLLDRGVGDTWRAAPSLVAAAARHDDRPAVPGPVWDCALEAARTDPAYAYAKIATRARTAFEQAADAGDPSALHRLGLLAESLGEQTEAELWFRRAADAGEPRSAARLGRILADRGDGKAAEPFLETAAEAGDAAAATLLGKLLRARAEHWFTAGAQAGDPEASQLLGDLKMGAGEDDDALGAYEDAMKVGYAPVARSYGRLLMLFNDLDEAEVWLRRAAEEGGDKRATEMLRFSFGPSARIHDPEDDLTVMAGDGDPLMAAALGRFLELRGRPDEARPWYVKGYEQGDAYAAFRLAALHKESGDEPEAALWHARAAALGHPAAQSK
ncbi:hypothetical protein MUU72_18590 [Streptomyces sp. RS10V-4]|uniref:hypothetical protein n=1 Tax=Streptomyces rhizoryzae TaxID=2932493 RepID=UPI002002B6C8|nr:hypothetical protein [Streptomyces rhizoryzae]MCK7625094.1 hypothetical protein [Streptomyces rhizoryzae]